MDAWSKYKVNPKKRNERLYSDRASCREFSTVGHTTHVDVAMNILRERRIRPGLVFDKSTLNTTRTLVAWLSPNTWGYGYRYGNIKFDFDFRTLVAGKNAFWVEVIDAYSPHACRVLVTSQDRSDTLDVYDPESGAGPWWYDKMGTGKDYYNNNYCLEFMFEEEIELSNLESIEFVQHHNEWCSLHRTAPHLCKEKGLISGKGGALLLTKLAAAGFDMSSIQSGFVNESAEQKNSILSHTFKDGLNHMLQKLRKEQIEFIGPLSDGADTAQSVARGVLNAMAINKLMEAIDLAAMFDSEESLLRAVASIVAEVFGTSETERIYKSICW